MDNQNIPHGEDVQLVVTLLGEDGKPYDVIVLNSFMYENNQYVSTIPVIPDSTGNYDIYLFQTETKEGQEPDKVDVEFKTIPPELYSSVAEFYEKVILPMDEDKIP